MANKICNLAVTPGDPAGIGPDLAIMLKKHQIDAKIVVIADKNVMKVRAEALGFESDFNDYNARFPTSGSYEVLHIDCQNTVVAGQGDSRNASYILATLDRAAEGCLTGEFDAMITGPINKEIILRAGIPFTGHTEYLAKLTDTKNPVMLLTDGKLRVALVTIHMPLSKVAKNITRSNISTVAQILHYELQRRFNITKPTIGVCGLNPHAGEGGKLGNEEIEEIIPALLELQNKGIDAQGPFPADTIFIEEQLERFDAVLAMYHDQGLPVIKHRSFGEVVNITLGLPIIRTSVDHGTAYDLAASGKASDASMLRAVSAAKSLCLIQ